MKCTVHTIHAHTRAHTRTRMYVCEYAHNSVCICILYAFVCVCVCACVLFDLKVCFTEDLLEWPQHDIHYRFHTTDDYEDISWRQALCILRRNQPISNQLLQSAPPSCSKPVIASCQGPPCIFGPFIFYQTYLDFLDPTPLVSNCEIRKLLEVERFCGFHESVGNRKTFLVKLIASVIGFGHTRLPSNCECFPANYSLVCNH